MIINTRENNNHFISHVLYADGSFGREYYGKDSVFDILFYAAILIDV